MPTLLADLRERKLCAEDIVIIGCVVGFDEALLQCLSEWYDIRADLFSSLLLFACTTPPQVHVVEEATQSHRRINVFVEPIRYTKDKPKKESKGFVVQFVVLD